MEPARASRATIIVSIRSLVVAAPDGAAFPGTSLEVRDALPGGCRRAGGHGHRGGLRSGSSGYKVRLRHALRQPGRGEAARRRCAGDLSRAPAIIDRRGPGACLLLFLDRKSTRLNSSHLVISYA